MQRPTDSLRAEHVLAARGVRVLAAIAGAVRIGDPFPAADCAATLRFLREWVLAVHMRKEDEVLAPAVAMRGDEEAAAIVGELMRLHEEVTELAHSLMLFWEPSGPLTPTERAGFAETVDALVGRLELRQRLEEELLFPACDRYVPADDQLDWAQEFTSIDDVCDSQTIWTARVAALANRWLS